MPKAIKLANDIYVDASGVALDQMPLDEILHAEGYPHKNLLLNTARTTTTNGVTFTVNADRSVTANGTASADATLILYTLSNEEKAAVDGCVLSGCPSGGSTSKYFLMVQQSAEPRQVYATDTGNGATITNSSQGSYGAYVYIRVCSGQTVSNLVFHPMIRLASITDDSYVPYSKTNAELTSFTTMFKRFNMDITFDSGAAQIPLATFGFSSDWNVQITHRYKSGSNAGYSFSTQFNGDYFVLYAREADGSLPANGKVLNVDILATHF